VLLVLLWPFFQFPAQAQYVYEHVNHREIYLFLDEMANIGMIDLTSVVKPYTRETIQSHLREVQKQRSELNNRQRKMLDFYGAEFGIIREADHRNFDLKRGDFRYEDPDFNARLRPILGARIVAELHTPELVQYQRHNGAEAWASIRKNWGVYASLRDNFVSKYPVLPDHLTTETGGAYKEGSSSAVEFSEMRAGIVYGNRWFTAGLIKDHPEWGEHYFGANIFAPKTPSFAHVILQLRPVKWLEFTYFHAWLNSGLIDSAKSYTYTNAYGTRPRHVYREKFLAANMFVLKPWKRTYLFFGNSIVYADMGFHPAYLIPVSFFKSSDHTLNATSNRAGQNAQMFFGVSSRKLRNTHFFATLFVDEIAISNIFNPDEHSNFISLKTGFNLSNFPMENLHITGEYTRTNPLVYQHFTPSTTYATNDFNLGHYLRDNAEQTCLALTWEPMARWRGQLSYSYSRKGPDYNSMGGRRRGLPFMAEEQWRRSELMASAGFQVLYNAWAIITYRYTQTSGADALSYHPESLVGSKHLLEARMHIGL
jgi:hypothetical protein